MAKVYVIFADGVEEIEALTAVDILRRGGQDVVMVSVTGQWMIRGSHGIEFTVNRLFDPDEISGGPITDGDMIVLPGGGAGTKRKMGRAGGGPCGVRRSRQMDRRHLCSAERSRDPSAAARQAGDMLSGV